MRTTLSLDEDVAKLLNKEIRRNSMSFKQAVNHFLRIGLANSSHPNRKPFTVTPRALGLPPGMSYDNVGELLEALESTSEK